MSDLTNEIRRIMQAPGMCAETRTLLQMALESERANEAQRCERCGEPAALNSHLCGLCADDQLNGR